jgi:hypothetical protein
MTPEQLTRRALALGAELEIDGRTINASRQRLAVVPQPKKPAPAPAAPAAPAPTPDPLAGIAPLIEAQARVASAQSESITAIMGALLAELSKPRDGTPRPLPVAFDIERDSETTLITRIVPVYRQGALN